MKLAELIRMCIGIPTIDVHTFDGVDDKFEGRMPRMVACAKYGHREVLFLCS